MHWCVCVYMWSQRGGALFIFHDGFHNKRFLKSLPSHKNTHTHKQKAVLSFIYATFHAYNECALPMILIWIRGKLWLRIIVLRNLVCAYLTLPFVFYQIYYLNMSKIVWPTNNSKSHHILFCLGICVTKEISKQQFKVMVLIQLK